jgi:hypothetical protein
LAFEYAKIAEDYASHASVNHGAKEFVSGDVLNNMNAKRPVGIHTGLIVLFLNVRDYGLKLITPLLCVPIPMVMGLPGPTRWHIPQFAT